MEKKGRRGRRRVKVSNNSVVVSKRTSLEYWVMTNSYEYYTLENGGNQKKKKIYYTKRLALT